jgi:hypothetical protein
LPGKTMIWPMNGEDMRAPFLQERRATRRSVLQKYRRFSRFGSAVWMD